ncbi:S1 family peptidase [Methylobrevis albus]|uniref:Serine protease n=1 Tax=Methylobrevis albus TaxID=2793297 RepID=A0A931I047_9HYPH|nr:serine protease [Methylobrevis albus]MBH0236853.1 trypsin-like peptidase domain-containing protein [Methylobrevis albus]
MRPVSIALMLAALIALGAPSRAENLNDLLKAPVQRAQDGLAADPLAAAPAPVAPAAPLAVAPVVVPAAPMPVAVVPPAAVVPAPAGPDTAAAAPLGKAALRDLARNATVLVLNLRTVKKGGGLVIASTGSGFFIDPQTVMTNSHVVAGAEKLILSVAGAGPVVAEVVSDTFVHENGRADFALLRTSRPVGLATLALGTPVDSLTEVFAVGYPGVVTERDQGRLELLQGDLSAAPSVVISIGTVQNVMDNDSGVEMITHSAMMHRGNSGGPLLNGCGQVIGVNTQISLDRAALNVGGKPLVDKSGNSVGNVAVHGGFGFAQSVDEMRRFLRSRQQAFAVAGPCAE